MARPTRAVKPPRSYDATSRRKQAHRTRERIVAAAEQGFLRDGYAGTTIASIAAAADVSADTVYKSFGGKPGLVRAVRERALEGTGPVPAETRSDALQTRARDGYEIVAAWGTLTAEVAPRVAPILLLVRDAATNDPEVEALRDELDAERLRRMTDNAQRLRTAGHLRRGVSVARAADILWSYSAPELYELLVLRRNWTPRRYGHFIGEALADALLERR